MARTIQNYKCDEYFRSSAACQCATPYHAFTYIYISSKKNDNLQNKKRERHLTCTKLTDNGTVKCYWYKVRTECTYNHF